MWYELEDHLTLGYASIRTLLSCEHYLDVTPLLEMAQVDAP